MVSTAVNSFARRTDVRGLLKQSIGILEDAGIDSPALDAEVMLSEAMGVTRTFLLAHPEERPPPDALARFTKWAQLRIERMPLAYIIGHREFYGLDFEVGPEVLIPRPETELLVEETIRALEGIESPVIADIGVGSGAVAVAFTVAIAHARTYATDASLSALEVAHRNAERHSVADRIEFRHGDLIEPLKGMAFDAVVSNPPYIPTGEIDNLQPEIARYEPRDALDGGPDGLDWHRRIVPESREYLKPGGRLLLEVGQGQAANVMAMMAEVGFEDVHAIRDYAGIERVVSSRFKVQGSRLPEQALTLNFEL